MKSFGSKDMQVKKYFEQDVLTSIYSPVKRYTDNQAKNQNIVIIILESFSKEYIGSLNNGSGYTPFLDSLINKSLVFSNAYANGKRSMEAMPSIIAGLPALTDETYITSRYASNQINSIATVLKEKGYYTAFFHGGKNGTMGFDKFAEIAGFEKYYGMNEYPNNDDYDGNWGIYDEPYLKYFAHKMSDFDEPFFTSVFTLTSHHPYEVPKKYKGKFPKGTLNIHESIGYTDFALKQFFKEAKELSWFSNTLFILTADHTAQAESAFYKNKLGNYAIPIIFYHPTDSLFKGKSEIIAQQTDIFPTIIDYLGITKPFICFGNSLLNDSDEQFNINYINGVYQIYNDDHLLQFDGNKSIGLYHISNDSLLQKNMVNKVDEMRDLEDYLKAIIQTYQQRVVTNNLTIH
jgi:phosphoglycerol transferase MdoB-like AlkP superfamily enzyme